MSDFLNVDIFAGVLTGDHYHIALKKNRVNLSRSMQWSGEIYMCRFSEDLV